MADDLTDAKLPEWHLAQADGLLQSSARSADADTVHTQERAARQADRASAHALTAIGMLLARHNQIQEELLT